MTMRNWTPALALSLLLAPVASLNAQDGAAGGVRAVTEDGRSVLLMPDGTWSYATSEAGSPSSSAVLSVTDLVEMDQACGLQLRLPRSWLDAHPLTRSDLDTEREYLDDVGMKLTLRPGG